MTDYSYQNLVSEALSKGARPSYLIQGLMGLLDVPRRAFNASEEYRQGGEYDPGPILEAASIPMGGTFAGAPAGAVGAGPVRGRRLGANDFNKILSKQRSSEFTGSGEHIASAALRVGDRVIESISHPQAAIKAYSEGLMYPRSDSRWRPGQDMEDGFVTSRGRFVNRKDAHELFTKAKQGDPWLSGEIGLDSADLNNPKPGKP